MSWLVVTSPPIGPDTVNTKACTTTFLTGQTQSSSCSAMSHWSTIEANELRAFGQYRGLLVATTPALPDEGANGEAEADGQRHLEEAESTGSGGGGRHRSLTMLPTAVQISAVKPENRHKLRTPGRQGGPPG